jgi:hypothetical protein
MVLGRNMTKRLKMPKRFRRKRKLTVKISLKSSKRGLRLSRVNMRRQEKSRFKNTNKTNRKI